MLDTFSSFNHDFAAKQYLRTRIGRARDNAADFMLGVMAVARGRTDTSRKACRGACHLEFVNTRGAHGNGETDFTLHLRDTHHTMLSLQ